ncbi:MAG: 2-oxoglutarate dehydrogenase complex dihydrolipoyllysine-residue succinyltransferase [Myxococcota bacterium]
MSKIVDVPVPSPGESITTVYILAAHKSVGDVIMAGEAIFEVETDKANLEIPAPVSGIVHALMVGEGDEVDVGSIAAKISEQAVEKPKAPVSKESDDSIEANKGSQSGPAARLEADRLSVNIDDVQGSGNNGRILRKDVQAAAQKDSVEGKQANTNAHDPTQLETRVKMTPLRRTIAQRLVEAQQTAAILTTFNEADMTNIKKIRAKYQDRFVKKYGIKLGFMSFFVKAAVEALKAYPAVNAEIDGDSVVYKKYYNIGVAVSTQRGLVVPVLRDAQSLSFAGIESGIQELALKARDGKLRLDDFKGGTFTISNGGVFGSLMSTPILNPPQVGILGMHTIQERPVNVNGQVEIRPMMYLALSYDHRIIDGREAVSFLVRIKELVENPERILFEV